MVFLVSLFPLPFEILKSITTYHLIFFITTKPKTITAPVTSKRTGGKPKVSSNCFKNSFNFETQRFT